MIQFNPSPGEILICNFSMGGFEAPEMIKARPVVILSRKSRIAPATVIVVPFSASRQNIDLGLHHRIPAGRYSFFNSKEDVYAKADMIAHVKLGRLDRLEHEGKRLVGHLETEDLRAIKQCVLRALNMGRLTA